MKNVILNNSEIKKLYNITQKHTKYSLDDIIEEILFILKTGISWRNIRSNIHWNSIYFHYKRFVKFNIFKITFFKLRSLFFKNNSSCNIQIIDSSFILNKFGKNKIARNKFFKNKNCNKISYITDSKGIPLSVFVDSGNVHDLFFIKKHMKDIGKLNKHHNIYLLADKAYESKNHREFISNYNYTFIIPKKKNMTTNYFFDKAIYKKRLHVEHAFQKLKTFRRIMIRYDSLFTNYLSFVYLASAKLIYKALSLI